MLEEEEDTTVLLGSWEDHSADDDNIEHFGMCGVSHYVNLACVCKYLVHLMGISIAMDR